MTDRLTRVHAHLDRLRAKDPELANELEAVVEKIEAMAPAEACLSWEERAKRVKAPRG